MENQGQNPKTIPHTSEHVGEVNQSLGIKFKPIAPLDTPQKRLERAIKSADDYNNTPNPNGLNGPIKCDKCMGRGDFLKVEQDPDTGYVYTWLDKCSCSTMRESYERMLKSGLESIIGQCRFDNYIATEDWQINLKNKALKFCKDTSDAWFFVGGNVGAGKTHICTAITREFLRKMPARYEIWPELSNSLKSNQFTDNEVYEKRINQVKNVKLLYIDDFFKITKDSKGEDVPPSPADVRLAHELLNHRSMAKLKTIISSERQMLEIVQIDQATAGRISYCAGEYVCNIRRKEGRDYRLKNAGQMI